MNGLFIRNGILMVQIKISLTCPKTPVQFNGNGGDLNFEDEDTLPNVANMNPTAMSEDEKATLDRLMKELDL